MRFLDIILDLLFPAYCVSCKRIGSFLCIACSAAIPLSEPACFVCNARNSNGSICNSCRRHMPYLTRVWWASAYDTESIRHALMQLKYNGNRALASALASFIVASVKKRAQAHNVHIPSNAALLAIPLHTRKKRERGFNQSEIIGFHVSHELLLPILPPDTLTRIKHTPPQAQAGGKEQRKKNMEHAFVISDAGKLAVAGKTIILIDDVATTGSTLNDAARALKEAGAAHVWGLVVAKG